MAESKKRFPNQKLYIAIHDFFNKEAYEFPGNLYTFEDVMTEIGYVFKANGDVVAPDKSYVSRRSLTQRWFEVRDDINKRLEKHNVTWRLKQGQGKGAKYCYEQPIPYDFPKECEDESALYNVELLRDVIGYTQTPFSNKSVKRDIISFSSNDLLGKIELVKELFLAIKGDNGKGTVIEITYTGMHGNKPKTILISPHYLKQYNNRWFLFGRVENYENETPSNLNEQTFYVDRIDDDIKKRADLEYHESDIDFSTYFDDIVGVTHNTNAKPVDVDITTFDAYTHARIMSKPIHEPQKELKTCEGNNEPGLIQLEHICINNELMTQLLSFGDSISAKWEGKSYSDFLKRIDRMHDRYTRT